MIDHDDGPAFFFSALTISKSFHSARHPVGMTLHQESVTADQGPELLRVQRAVARLPKECWDCAPEDA